MIQIFEVDGNYPLSILVKDNEILYIIEEFKLNPKLDYKEPIISTKMLKEMFKVEDKDIIKGLPNLTPKSRYLGIGYDKGLCFEIIKNNGLYYELFQAPYAKPKDLFSRVVELVNKDLKVGWFQGRNLTANGIDFNRCIIQKTEDEITFYDYEIKDNELFKRFIEEYGSTRFFPRKLNAYSPIQAIDKLKNKEIDALVINNCICFLIKLEED